MIPKEIKDKASKFFGFKDYDDVLYWGTAHQTNDVNRLADLLATLITPEKDRNAVELPDPSSQRWGWEARKIDGKWRVGMKGNLDTIHDATVVVNGFGSDVEAQKTAMWIAYQYNMCVKDRIKNDPKQINQNRRPD